jgi:ribose/xylose/arabinose/galactoside ABC-type transport system permease subunit
VRAFRRIDWKRVRTVTAWVLLLGALVGWPASMLTLARNEPPFVLSLSWLAIVIEASSLLTASQVHENQDASDE